MKDQQSELHRRIGSLFGISLKMSCPVSQLHLIREKMAERGYQGFDKEGHPERAGESAAHRRRASFRNAPHPRPVKKSTLMEITEIKSSLPIGQVLDHYGLKADKNGRLCCPFHDDKTPSMQVYAETGTVHCFSANCKLHGKAIDVIDFILHKEGITKHEAISKAKELTGYNELAQPSAFAKASTYAEASADKSADTFEKLFKVFQSTLKKSEKAKTYLKERNIEKTETDLMTGRGSI